MVCTQVRPTLQNYSCHVVDTDISGLAFARDNRRLLSRASKRREASGPTWVYECAYE